MNKARMTIRFDHDPPKGRNKDHAREEHDADQSVPAGHNPRVYDHHSVFDEYDTAAANRFTDTDTSYEPQRSAQQDHLRVVPPLREEWDNRDVDDRDWRPSRNHRSKARLATRNSTTSMMMRFPGE